MTSGVEKKAPMLIWRSMRDRRDFAPVRGVKERRIESPIGGENPALVLFGSFGLEIPEQFTGLQVARFQRAVEHAEQDHVTCDDGRRKRVRFDVLAQNRFAGGCLDHVIKTRVRGAEENLSLRHRRRADDPTQLARRTSISPDRWRHRVRRGARRGNRYKPTPSTTAGDDWKPT